MCNSSSKSKYRLYNYRIHSATVCFYFVISYLELEQWPVVGWQRFWNQFTELSFEFFFWYCVFIDSIVCWTIRQSKILRFMKIFLWKFWIFRLLYIIVHCQMIIIAPIVMSHAVFNQIKAFLKTFLIHKIVGVTIFNAIVDSFRGQFFIWRVSQINESVDNWIESSVCMISVFSFHEFYKSRRFCSLKFNFYCIRFKNHLLLTFNTSPTICFRIWKKIIDQNTIQACTLHIRRQIKHPETFSTILNSFFKNFFRNSDFSMFTCYYWIQNVFRY